MAMPVAPQQRIYPIHAKTRKPIAGRGLPKRYICLCAQQLKAAIRTAIINNQEMPNTKRAIMLQHTWQALKFIA